MYWLTSRYLRIFGQTRLLGVNVRFCVTYEELWLNAVVEPLIQVLLSY